MKHIKIWFADFPPDDFVPKDNWIINRLRERYEVELSDAPDFLFFSVFGYNYLNYTDCVKIFFTGELSVPNFNACDYAFSFNYLDFGARHMRAVLGDEVADTITNIKPTIQDRSKVTGQMAQRRFCNFIYSQHLYGEGASLRKDFCLKLMEYKRVDCPGNILNNMPPRSIAPRWNGKTCGVGNINNAWNQGKLDFIKDYKFTIAFENILSDGYTTEKIIHPFMSYSIPIYWGNPLVTRDFNPKAFINCNDYSNFEDVISRIRELDNDEHQYLEMLRQPPMRDTFDFHSQEHARDYLYRIIERGNHPFFKGGFSADVAKQLKEELSETLNAIHELQISPESTAWKLVRAFQKFFQTKFGKLVKSILKPILRLAIKMYHGLKKIFHKGN